ncbi:MAG: flagellin [Dehalococcoidales bacterium]|nr:flagellin [Dehalococcoidales bacterium]
MGVRINTNIEALDAQRNLAITASSFAKSVEKLSSGLRINRAGDDAAGLSISEKLRGQVRGLNQAVRNAQDGISLIQTAEGALDQVTGIIQRMRELSVQASNDTLTSSDRSAIASELTALRDEINRISTQSEFNTQKLLDGTYSGKNLHIGANNGQTMSITISNAQSTAIGSAGSYASLSAAVDAFAATTGLTASIAENLIQNLDQSLTDISSTRASLGAYQNRLEYAIANLSVSSENLAASESRIRDVDVAAEMVNFTKTQILQQAGTAILAQANSAPQSVLQLLR